MRTLVDAVCPGCGEAHVDLWASLPELPHCVRCRRPLARTHAVGAVRPDSIPGGYWVEHGLCNLDGSPRRYDSYSDMRREARRRGLRQSVEHVADQGSDKSPHTTRWV